MLQKKALYLVAIHIGNEQDITLRAIETLKNADLVIGEERPSTEKTLKRLGITNKEIITLNEHNEKKEATEILKYIMEKEISAALISEAGTPCIADPGASLVNLFHKHNLKVIPIPGVSSIITALMTSGIITEGFKYIGFLPANNEKRLTELKKLSTEKLPIVILETPYRMKAILKDIHNTFGNNKQIVFAYKLTQPNELIIKSTISDIITKTANLPKGEFVIVLLP